MRQRESREGQGTRVHQFVILSQGPWLVLAGLENGSKNEMYLQGIYQSSNKEMFAISLSSCSCYNETLNWLTNHSVRYS
jgi:hypothetical protein